MQRRPHKFISLERYFSFEETSPERHEYYRPRLDPRAAVGFQHRSVVRQLGQHERLTALREAAHHFALDRLTTEPSHALREHDDGIKIELPPGNLPRPR